MRFIYGSCNILRANNPSFIFVVLLVLIRGQQMTSYCLHQWEVYCYIQYARILNPYDTRDGKILGQFAYTCQKVRLGQEKYVLGN